MLIIPVKEVDQANIIKSMKKYVKEGENIDRALKRFKRKFDRTKTMKNLRNRKNFTKPSVANRAQRIKASYVQKLKTQEEVG